MGVEEADERRAVARDVVQDRVRDGIFTEHVRIEPPPEEPVLPVQRGDLGPQAASTSASVRQRLRSAPRVRSMPNTGWMWLSTNPGRMAAPASSITRVPSPM